MKGGHETLLGLALFDREWSNIRAGQAWAAAQFHDHEEAADLCSGYPDAGVYCLNLRLHSREWIQWLSAGIAASRYLKDRETEGRHLGNLGLAYADLGENRRAIELYEQRLTIAREIGDRRGEGNALGNLGNAYADLGETRRAIELYELRLTIARDIGDRRGEAIAGWNLGNEVEKTGDLARAADLMQVYVNYEREIGHPDAEKSTARVAALRARIADAARD